MASNAISGIVDEFLVCQVCLEDFKQPKMLPCLHTFCQPCLEKLLAAEPEGKLDCPTCRQDVPLPQNGVRGLKSKSLLLTTQVRPNVAISNTKGDGGLKHVKTVGGERGIGDVRGGTLTNGELLVTGDGHKIHVLDKQGRKSRVIQVTGAAETVDNTRGIAVDGLGRIIVTIGHEVFVLSPSGDVMLKFGGKGQGEQQLSYCLSLAVNSINQIIICDYYLCNVKVFNPTGRHLFTCGSLGSRPGELEDNIIVGNEFRVSLFSRDGTFVKAMLTEEEPGFLAPMGLALTHNGQLVDTTTVSAYFPDTPWYDYYTGQEVEGEYRGQTVTLAAPLNKINVHVRGGAILPTQQPANTTVYSRKNPMGLLVAMDDASAASGTLFWDDGEAVEFLKHLPVLSDLAPGTKSCSGWSGLCILAELLCEVVNVPLGGPTPGHWASLRYGTVSVYGLALGTGTPTVRAGRVNGPLQTIAASRVQYDGDNKVLRLSDLQAMDLPITQSLRFNWS
ncbi:hypothetical protein Bbelb_077510 [Branchiostoma belcheri]|nr:hypothetical protein Bbelb_077510 [Branchiostoma belcheri]